MSTATEGFVLFSPIGTTDPISGCRDGAMLHIARIYRPRKIFLYFSNEMCALHKKDNRYLFSIDKLGEKLAHHFETEIDCRENLTDVHLFDFFYNEFTAKLNNIAAQSPSYRILLNVSSGTPAMKAALQTIAALSGGERLLPIQVSTPEKKSNGPRGKTVSYDVQLEWECNEDNEDSSFCDRSAVSTHLNLSAKIAKEAIIKQIDSYDYHAALMTAGGISSYLSQEAKALLAAAAARVQLDISGVTKALSQSCDKIIPIEDGSLRDMAEYLLVLEVKLRRTEYADFIRGVTPLVADIFELYLSKKLKINIKKYCYSSRNINNSKYVLSRSLLEKDENGRKILETLDSHYRGFKDCPYASDHLLVLLKEFAAPQEVLNTAEKIRHIESSCRNIAAHEIVSISPGWIEGNCGHSPAVILALLFDMADYSGICKEKIINSYTKMNERIKNLLTANIDSKTEGV